MRREEPPFPHNWPNHCVNAPVFPSTGKAKRPEKVAQSDQVRNVTANWNLGVLWQDRIERGKKGSPECRRSPPLWGNVYYDYYFFFGLEWREGHRCREGKATFNYSQGKIEHEPWACLPETARDCFVIISFVKSHPLPPLRPLLTCESDHASIIWH